MRCKVAVLPDAAQVVNGEQDLRQLQGDLVLDSDVRSNWFVPQDMAKVRLAIWRRVQQLIEAYLLRIEEEHV